MENKICTTCKINKPITEFHKYKDSKDGHTHRCKVCVSRKRMILNDKKKCTFCNESKNLEDFHNRKLGKMGKSSICKQCQNIKLKKYREENVENIKKNRNDWRNKKNKVNSLFKLKNNVRCRIYDFFNFRKINKNNKTFDIIGCTPEYLKEYIENKFTENMSWDNYGIFGWHIDHIIPLSSANTDEEIYKLCHYTNLQPLWAEENIKKSNKIIN